MKRDEHQREEERESPEPLKIQQGSRGAPRLEITEPERRKRHEFETAILSENGEALGWQRS